MFLKQIKKDIEDLKMQVYGKVKKEVLQRSFFDMYLPVFYSSNLKDSVDDLEKQVNKIESRFNLLLKRFGIEYHKITDENGETDVKEVYKKIKKQPKKRKIETDDED